MQMADRGRGGGRRTFNCGRRHGLSLGAPITTNPSTSSIHISTLELMIHVVAPTPNTLPTAQDQPNTTFVRESIPITPITDASPSAPNDSLTPEYPPDPNCEHIVDQRPFIRAYKEECQLTFTIGGLESLRKSIGGIHKKSEPLELFLRQKSKDFQRPPTAWEVMEKTKKLKSGKWVNDKSHEFAEKYQHRRNEILQHSTEEGTSTQDSPNTATSINDNEIYLNVVGGPNYKGNVYRLGTLSKRFSCSKLALSTSIAPVEDQIEEMHETINKLNVELLAKANKEKTLEKKMLRLMENHDHQSQEMQQ
ncbi:hypothetical protein JHK84_028067 [Glycine max]|nr:hypothetical protein JHK85_028483 [Glycine max]KAG5003814.1 hypothetical protein JHK86_027953 [Glycine max]KAG5151595.1 hypothetical protein JHK84_028067 [Glycine max]